MWPRGDELAVACEPSGSDIPVTALPAIAQDLVESVQSVEEAFPHFDPPIPLASRVPVACEERGP
jgi:hypothetical protein